MPRLAIGHTVPICACHWVSCCGVAFVKDKINIDIDIYLYLTQSPFPSTAVPGCFKTWNLESGGECARIILFYDFSIYNMLSVWGYVGRLYLYISKGLDKPSQKLSLEDCLVVSLFPVSGWIHDQMSCLSMLWFNLLLDILSLVFSTSGWAVWAGGVGVLIDTQVCL